MAGDNRRLGEFMEEVNALWGNEGKWVGAPWRRPGNPGEPEGEGKIGWLVVREGCGLPLGLLSTASALFIIVS